MNIITVAIIVGGNTGGSNLTAPVTFGSTTVLWGSTTVTFSD